MKLSLHMAMLATALSIVVPAKAEQPTEITVFKTPWCGCCHEWAEALAVAGYKVTTEDHEDLNPIKRMAGVPSDLEGCHTATVEGYFLEGHVPLEALSKLLNDRPEVAGLAVPGMPAGSLGMGSDPNASYTVYAVTDDGTSVFHEVGGD